jgi:ATP-dependent Clp protease ATP-binding subunit ClpA
MRIAPEVEVAFGLASREAERRRHEYVTVEHLLYALLFDEETKEVLRHAGSDTEALRKKLEKYMEDELESLKEEDFDSPVLSLASSASSGARPCMSGKKS